MNDLFSTPVQFLSSKTKLCLSSLLNPTKIIPSSNGLPRDWRGVADLLGLSGEIIPSIALNTDPINHILDLVVKNGTNKHSIKDFITILEGIERWDVIDDVRSLFEKDAENYAEQLKSSQKSADLLDCETDNKLLTVDDIYRINEGLDTQLYDAFLLYADDDEPFAEEMIEKLEVESDLKLCLKNRDLISGVTFEHDAIMQLISERCNRLIIIITSNFLKSSANKFFVNYAQAVSIEKAQRKIIPCLYENCDLPAQLKYTFFLDYSKSKSRSKIYDFWGRLKESIKSTKSINPPVKAFESEDEIQKENLACVSNYPEPQIIEEKVEEIIKDNLKNTNLTLTLKSEKDSSKSLKPFRLFTKSKKSVLLKPTESNPIKFPPLDGLDSFDSSTLEKNSKKKKKQNEFMKSCRQKIKLLVKS